MKRFLALAVAVASIGFLTAGTASAVDTYVAGDAAAGIAAGRHNLGGFSMHIGAVGTTEVCVFCHTPHHTNTANNLKPMWNRGTSAPTSFTAYGTTIAGSTISGSDIGSTSLACLSCHDGVTTFDNLVNAPGKAGVTNNGSDRGYTFYDFGTVVSDFMTSSRLNLGLNLSNDHPVSVTYLAGTAAGLRATNTTISSIDLTSEMNTSAATYDNGNLTKNLWAVKGFVSDTATIADLLRSSKVECSSCHDPHFNNKSWQEVDSTYSNVTADQEGESNGLFIRRVGGNTGSGVCRTCHEK